MRILFYLRADIDTIAGGDVVEARLLAEALSARGHDARVVCSTLAPDGSWEIVHLFNIDRAAELGAFLDANRSFPGAAVVFSPVHGWKDHDLRTTPSRLNGRLSRFTRSARSVANLVRGDARPSRHWMPGAAVARLAERVEGLTFHTPAEKHAFLEAYPEFLRQPSAVIVPPLDLVPGDSAISEEVRELRPYVASIGRIEPLKNQRWLLRSGIESDLNLVFAGRTNPKRPLYASRFRRDVGRSRRFFFLGGLDRGGVAAVLENAVAHILPSTAENFGLTTLEALGRGCEALIPNGHPAATVLGDCVHLFDLRDPSSAVSCVQAVRAGERRSQHFSPGEYSPGAVVSKLLGLYQEIREAAHAPD